MLKKKIQKNILISLSCLFIIGILYLFPTRNNNKEVSNNVNTDIIYLIDNNNYVARVNTILTSKDTLDKVREMINILTINSNNYIRKGFNKIIPSGTKLISVSLENDIVKLNFNKNFLNVKKCDEEKMIQAIVYTLTNLDGIKYVSIFVNNELLTNYPNSKKDINAILGRDIGINKEFNISNYSDIDKTTIYYMSKYNNYYYYVPVTKFYNNKLSKIEVIIKELSSSKLLNTNLITYLNSNTELLSYNETDKTLLLNFNDSILNDINTNNILEEVTYSINLSIKENYNVNEVLYYVNDNIISTFKIK